MSTNDFEGKFKLLGSYDKIDVNDTLPFNDSLEPQDLLNEWLINMGVNTRVSFLSYLLMRYQEGGLDAIEKVRYENEVNSFNEDPMGHLDAVFTRLESLFGIVIPQALTIAKATLEALRLPEATLANFDDKHTDSSLASPLIQATLGTKEAAAYLSVAVNTLSKYVAKGILRPVTRQGSRLNLFYVSDLDAYKATAKPKKRKQELNGSSAEAMTSQVEMPSFIPRKRKAKRR